MNKKKILMITTAILVVIIAAFIYVKFFFVFGEGVKAGELNYFVYKGYVFKTYEGRLIQSGIRGGNQGTFQSNEFEFSVTNQTIADSLMLYSGQAMELHYKEYLGTIPWRGHSKYVVDKIVSVKSK